jgi:outer membrane PBP1 activator LpoA protein
MTNWLTSVIAIAVALVLAACSTESTSGTPGSVTQTAEPADVIDQELMIFLGQAKNDVRLDARARLAKLLLARDNLEDAMRIVAEGLAPRQRESFFVANLYTVKGEIHEALAAHHVEAKEPAKADDERRAAIAAYDRSIQINEALQKKLMEGR